MTDESIPTRVWTVHVRKEQKGTVTIRESDLDFDDDTEELTFDKIRARAIATAQQRADADHGVLWSTIDVFHGDVSWA